MKDKKKYFRPANFTFDPQIVFVGNICDFRPDFRGQKVAILVVCRINIIFEIFSMNTQFIYFFSFYTPEDLKEVFLVVNVESTEEDPEKQVVRIFVSYDMAWSQQS